MSLTSGQWETHSYQTCGWKCSLFPSETSFPLLCRRAGGSSPSLALYSQAPSLWPSLCPQTTCDFCFSLEWSYRNPPAWLEERRKSFSPFPNGLGKEHSSHCQCPGRNHLSPLRPFNIFVSQRGSWAPKFRFRTSPLQTQHMRSRIPLWNMVTLGAYFFSLKLWGLSSNWGIKRKFHFDKWQRSI